MRKTKTDYMLKFEYTMNEFYKKNSESFEKRSSKNKVANQSELGKLMLRVYGKWFESGKIWTEWVR